MTQNQDWADIKELFDAALDLGPDERRDFLCARAPNSSVLAEVWWIGDVLGSLRCDCGAQLEFAMRGIADEHRGLSIYEQQEGRRIGLMAKLQAYALQDQGLDTVEANEALGLPIDHRDYSLPVAILQYLGIERVRLLTNNPDALKCAGIYVVEKIACEAAPNPNSIAYLKAKRETMGHTLRLCISEEDSCDFTR
jgi:GTP cyclohydrolase II